MDASTTQVAARPRVPLNGLRSAAELAADRPHGTRLKYMAGCRCADCRRANTDYETQRAKARRNGDWNGLVSTEPVRAHLAALAAAGVGLVPVADASGVRRAALMDIVHGRKQRIRARSASAVLAVTPAVAADRALVDAAPTWRMLDELIADGHTRAELARQLGKQRALQLKRTTVTVRNAHEVQRLYQALRRCPSATMQRQLAELSEEGFHRNRVATWLQALADKRGIPMPDLSVRNGRVQQRAAELVAQLHAQLLCEPETGGAAA